MPLPTEPQRRAEPRKHLDASVVPVERALLARAAEIEGIDSRRELRDRVRQSMLDHGLSDDGAALSGWTAHILADAVSGEYRALAKELYYW